MGKWRKTRHPARAARAAVPGSSGPPGRDTSSHERLHRVLEQMRAVVVEVGRDGRYLYVSPSVSQLLGYAPEDFLDRDHFGWIHEEDVPLLRDATRRLRHTGESIKLAFRARHKSGYWVWLESTTSLFRTSDGDLRTLTFAHDLTEARRAGEALRESEDRYRALTQNFSDLVLELDATGRFTFVSPSCTRILGVPPETLVGRSLRELANSERVHPEDRTVLVRGMREARERRPISGRHEFRIQHPDGSWRWFDCQFSTYLSQDDSWRAVVTARDVTAAAPFLCDPSRRCVPPRLFLFDPCRRPPRLRASGYAIPVGAASRPLSTRHCEGCLCGRLPQAPHAISNYRHQ